MRVRVLDDITLEVLDDPEHDQRFKGHFIHWPNGTRRDIPMSFALPDGLMPTPNKRKDTDHAAQS